MDGKGLEGDMEQMQTNGMSPECQPGWHGKIGLKAHFHADCSMTQ